MKKFIPHVILVVAFALLLIWLFGFIKSSNNKSQLLELKDQISQNTLTTETLNKSFDSLSTTLDKLDWTLNNYNTKIDDLSSKVSNFENMKDETITAIEVIIDEKISDTFDGNTTKFVNSDISTWANNKNEKISNNQTLTGDKLSILELEIEKELEEISSNNDKKTNENINTDNEVGTNIEDDINEWPIETDNVDTKTKPNNWVNNNPLDSNTKNKTEEKNNQNNIVDWKEPSLLSKTNKALTKEEITELSLDRLMEFYDYLKVRNFNIPFQFYDTTFSKYDTLRKYFNPKRIQRFINNINGTIETYWFLELIEEREDHLWYSKRAYQFNIDYYVWDELFSETWQAWIIYRWLKDRFYLNWIRCISKWCSYWPFFDFQTYWL